MTDTILYIIQDTTRTGGANKSFHILIDGIKAKGIHVIVVCPNNRGIYSDLEQEGFDVRVVPMKNSLFPDVRSLMDGLLWLPRLCGRIIVNRLAIYKIKNISLANNVRLIHTNVSVIDIGYKAAKQLHIPHVWHIREYADKDFNFHYFPTWGRYHDNLRKSYSICITQDIQKHHALSNALSKVIYNCIVTPSIVPLPFSEKQSILYAGRVTKEKGIMILLEAYAASNTHLPLIMLGKLEPNSDISLEIMSFISQHHLEDKIQIVSEVPNISDYIQRAKIVVVPSVMEGFGRVLPEAMAIETLTIGRNTGGTKEQLDLGLKISGHEIGLRFLTSDELATNIKLVEGMDHYTYHSYTIPAKNVVSALYSPTKHIDSVFDYYQYILKQSKR